MSGPVTLSQGGKGAVFLEAPARLAGNNEHHTALQSDKMPNIACLDIHILHLKNIQ